jgi:hypothetical protein
MRAAFRKLWIGCAALLLALVYPTNGMPPVPQKITGKIEWFDAERRELVVTNSSARLLLAWRETDRLERTCLRAGDEMKAYYRKETGRLVIHDFSSRTLCVGCK